MTWTTRRILAILICIPILICAPAIATPEYLKQKDISPVILTYADLDRILVNVKSQVTSANKSVNGNGLPSAKATIQAGEESITLPDWESLVSVKSAPNPGRAFRFVFTQYDSSVSRIEIALSDLNRQIVVEGTDAAQVNAVYSYLKDAFDDFSGSIGGYGLRSALGLLAGSLGGGLILNPFISPLIMSLFKPGRHPVYPGRGSLLSVACGILLLMIVFMLPWHDWLAGFAVYSGSTSFIDRNINWISFFGVVVPATVGIITFLGRAIRMSHGSRSGPNKLTRRPSTENH